jgi:thioredoxin-related protein
MNQLREYIKWIIACSAIIGIIIFSINWFKPKEKTIPEFEYMGLDSSTKYYSKLIPKGRPTVFVYFSPDCDHCQEETEDWIKNINRLKKTRFFFITNDSLERLKIFNQVFKIYQYSNMELGWDYKWEFFNIFKPTGTPYLILYDKNNFLKAVIPGGAKSDTLISIINNL